MNFGRKYPNMSALDATAKESKFSLQLDPGPEPRAKTARRISISKCLCYAFIIVSIIIGFSICYLGARFVRGIWNGLLIPHSRLYHNESAPYEPHQVVRPLIEEDQTFDIVATVWIRDFEGKNPSQTRGVELIERPIFMDTIFRGIKMSKKIYRASVNLEVPTAAFQDTLLGNYDLRGSFVLVPSSPLMDKAFNYSTWVPPEAKMPPSRASLDGYTRTLADEVVDAYGISTPLLSFHEVKSRCQSLEQMEPSPPEKGDEKEIEPQALKFVKPKKKNEVTTEGKPVLGSHPYIITRTHLKIIDMTKLYKREAFEDCHRRLSMSECGEHSHNGLRSPDFPPDWRLCHRSFFKNGNCQVMIEYSPEEDTTSWSSNLAYAPYLFVDSQAWGPLDLAAVPVNREECSPINKDPETVNITWNISFGSITPRKEFIVRLVGWGLRGPVKMTDTEDAQQSRHSVFEFAQALLGQRFDQHRPPAWIAWFLLVSSAILALFEGLLRFIYWSNVSSTSTVGLSIIGTTSMAIGMFLDETFRLLFSEKSTYFTRMLDALFRGMPFLMVKALTRPELVWSKTIWVLTFPIGVRFARATHAERASQRVEARTSWRFRLLCFTLFAVTYYLAYIYDIRVISPKTLRPNDISPFKQAVSLSRPLCFLPMVTLGKSLQIIMNFQSRTFAGKYKLSACAIFFRGTSELVAMYLHPGVLAVEGMSLVFPLHILLDGVTIVQAILYPTPKVVSDSDDD